MDDRIGNLMLGDEERQGLSAVLDSGRLFRFHPSWTSDASFSERLEIEAAKILGCERSLALTSATAGLQIALIAMGVCPGDRVIVPAYSFLGTATSVLGMGALPLFVDIDASFGLDIDDLERKLDTSVRAVVVAHLQGVPANVEAIAELCRRKGVPLVEDCAQAFSAKLNGRSVGTFGDVGVYSFQANKIIASGEGGLVVARSPQIFDAIGRLHDQGCSRTVEGRPYWPSGAAYGFNYKINEPTSALAFAQLKKLDTIKQNLAKSASIVREALESNGIELRATFDAAGCVPVSVAFIAPNADAEKLVAELRQRKINASQLYTAPLYASPIFQEAQSPYGNGYPFNFLPPKPYVNEHCPLAERVSKESVWVMLNPTLTEGQSREIAAQLRTLVK